jgi:hypothetical protein
VGDAPSLPCRPRCLRVADPSFPGAEEEFVFVDDPDEVPADATPFDMHGVRNRARGALVDIYLY